MPDFCSTDDVSHQRIRPKTKLGVTQGKTPRRLASAFLWLLTLVLGAALGAYFKEIVAWGAKLAA